MANIAYYRVSTSHQTIENQRIELNKKHDIKKEFSDEISGTVKGLERPGFSEMMKYIREDDVLIVRAIDRLGRSNIDIQQNIEAIHAKGASILIDDLKIDTGTPMGRFVISMMGSLAEMEREQMLERQKAGIARAKAEGKFKGRRSTLDHKAIVEYRKSSSIKDTAEHFGISPATVKRVQKAVKEEKQKAQAEQAA